MFEQIKSQSQKTQRKLKKINIRGERTRNSQNKFCKYTKSHTHNTEDC